MANEAGQGASAGIEESPLLAPVALGARRSANRIMRLATTCNLGEANRVSPRMIAFYRRVAEGGAGSLVTESLRVHPSDTRSPTALALYDPGVVEGLRRLAEAVQREGALFIGQLNHGGRQHLGRGTPILLAPSERGCPRTGGTPRAMTEAEIEEMAAGFVRSADHCAEAGLDGVEIHGAQGHLIQQFLSPFSNGREDGWGGTPAKRLRFARGILEAVRRRHGGRMIIGFRLGVEEFTEGGLDIAQAEAIAEELARDGLVDYLSLSQGNFNTIETHLPDRHFAPAPFRALHRRIREAARDVPVVAGSRLPTPDVAEALITEGAADLVGFCRAFIADPAWPAKLAGRRPGPIRACIACNQCWAWISEGQPIGCAVNPEAGREMALGPLAPAPVPRHVVVVGAGPAGLEAARIAARRGHRVTVLEREAAPGGQLRRARGAARHEEIATVIDFLVADAAAQGAILRSGAAADAAAVAALRPDAIVLAAGARAEAPGLAGDGSVPVLTEPPPGPGAGRSVVVMDEDGYFASSAAVEAAIAAGWRVVLVSRFFEVLRDLPVVTRIATLRALDEAGTELRPNMAVHGADAGAVLLRHYLSGREERLPDCAAVLWVGRRRANDGLAEALRAIAPTRLVGDAYQPRRLPDALREGHAAGREA